MWGFLPIYWKQLDGIPVFELLAHRVFWAMLFLIPLLHYSGKWPEVKRVLLQPRLLLGIFLGAAFIGSNWYLYVWAVLNDRVLDASLGYFINPLINVFLGFLFLGERLHRLQWLAVLIAAIGVIVLTVHHGHLPFVALYLPVSFGLYGLIRKVLKVDVMVAFWLETVLLSPIAVVYLVILFSKHVGTFGTVSPSLTLLLMSAGLITAVPLVLFGQATRYLGLASLGFFSTWHLQPNLSWPYSSSKRHFQVYTYLLLVVFGSLWRFILE